EGKGFVNTYHGGDPTEGIMTSPEFVIDRDYLNFLIGGGDTGETSFELIIDGKIVRSITGQLFEIQAQIELAFAEETGLEVRGVDVVYHVKGQKVHCLGRAGPLAMTDGRIKLHLLVDRTSLEVFGNDGLLSMSSCMVPEDDGKSLAVFSHGGQTRFCELRLWELKSIWNN
ncbi:MAG: GH32 C-terminal domain-containing protein, partial [Planctomycetota bacterium]